MSAIEHNEDELDREGTAGDDHLAALINELIALVFERIPDTSSAEHRGVMTALLDLHRQLRSRPSGTRPTLN
jgi:hypothetical protein